MRGRECLVCGYECWWFVDVDNDYYTALAIALFFFFLCGSGL